MLLKELLRLCSIVTRSTHDRRYYLVINLKAAKQMGLTIPQKVLLRADEVVTSEGTVLTRVGRPQERIKKRGNSVVPKQIGLTIPPEVLMRADRVIK
jgi:hypothetical protein